jgi:tetratricopeptide (TPR) repeat protein
LVSPLPLAVLITLTGVSWNSTSNYRDAESYWLASLHHAPASPVAWNALGLARADKGRHEEAIASFKAAIEQDPSHSRAWSNLARSLLATDRVQEAESALETAVQTGPLNPIAHTNWGLHLERRGDHVGAREAYIRASLLRPGLPQAWAGIARTERRLGREAEAEIAEQRARSLGTRRGN